MGKRRWSDEQLRRAVESATTLCQAIGALGIVPRGANYALVKRRIAELALSTDHLRNARPTPFKDRAPRRPLEALLVEGTSVTTSDIRSRLIRAGMKSANCQICGWCERKANGTIPLELDHINGDRTDNRLENLRILCPNCHSHQPTHRALNARKHPPLVRTFRQEYLAPPVPLRPTRSRRWSDDDLRHAIPISRSYAEVLRRLGMKGSGARRAIYRRVRELDLDISHFVGQGWRRGYRVAVVPAAPLDQLLIRGKPVKSSDLRQRLIKDGLKRPVCERCGWCARAPDGRLPLELDHINGDHDDNRLENLRILCPNCHSLQPTHRGSNQSRHRNKNGAPGGT
jgi:5-methylcytosine-specific restriction endonuclease McrA